MKKPTAKTILTFVVAIAVILVMYRYVDYVNSLLINFLLLIFAIKVLQIKSWRVWRYFVVANVFYFILYELINMIYPIEWGPLQAVWVVTLIITVLSIGVYFIWKVKVRER
ncbi:hypothetical protein [Tepidibacillus marianensis]|uniref:hypothetical protein n=1 Tax=Tepidibacillus marianensis TaxID=3131995 RepID=UPI0030D3233D